MTRPTAKPVRGRTASPEPRAPKKPRTVVNRQKDRPAQFGLLRGIFDQPPLWELATHIPPQTGGGRQRKLPPIFYVAMPSLVAVCGSFSAAESALSEPEVWEASVRDHLPDAAALPPRRRAVPTGCPPGRRESYAQNYFDARRSWLKPYLHLLQGIFERHAGEYARELGYADPDGLGSCNHLVRDRTLIGDGKVTREPGSSYRTLHKDEEHPELDITAKTHVVDIRTGEIIGGKKMEGDAHLYLTGPGPLVGFKTVRLTVRNDRTNSSIVLAVRRPDTKDEAACAVQAAVDVRRRLPGLLAISYDTAIRGVHIRELARQARLVTVAPVAAAANTKGGERREKTVLAGRVPHNRPHGSLCVHTLYAHGGRLCEEVIDSHGKGQLIPCEDPTVVRFRDNRTGSRLYLAWNITCNVGRPEGAAPVKIKELAWTVTDDTSDFNVAENLRALPPGSERYDEAQGWRQSIENDNHQSDALKTLRRGRIARPDWNHINELRLGDHDEWDPSPTSPSTASCRRVAQAGRTHHLVQPPRSSTP